MARYLVPPKVGLLALISLYVEGVVPTGSAIAILSFISGFLIPASGSAPLSGSKDIAVSIDEFQRATITHASVIPGRTIWDLLLKRLWEINSFDSLHVFFDNLDDLLARNPRSQPTDPQTGNAQAEDKILLSRTSPLGAFVRRSQLEFTRLQFHDAMALWTDLITYREPTLSMWRKRNPAAGKMSFDVILQNAGLTPTDDLVQAMYGNAIEQRKRQPLDFVSTDDVEKLLEFQVAEMQKYGNRLPEQMRNQLATIAGSSIAVPSLSHYARFLDSWRAGDYPSSFDNLHRYFDYTMHNRDRTFYQYALLNLAILQADFGCLTEAIAAMQETVATARENKDMSCLNYSLSWLYHFGKAHPRHVAANGKGMMSGVEREGLNFLKAKAKETGMWSLLSTSLLSEAKLGLANGESVPFGFESITKASHLNLTKYVTNAVGPQMLLQSSLFARLGVNHLSWAYCEIFLECHAEQSPFEEVLKCRCRMAYMLAQKGRHKEALAMIDGLELESSRSLKHHQYLSASSGLIKLKHAVHRNDVEAAHHLISELSAIDVDSDLSFPIFLLHVMLLIRQRCYKQALQLLEASATKRKEDGADIYQRVRLLSLKAVILDKCGKPQKGLSLALRAATIAHRARILPILWEAMGVLCNVLSSLKEFEASMNLLIAIIPQVVESEDCLMTGDILSYLADAYVGLAGSEHHNSPKQNMFLTKALEAIDRAFNEYTHIEDVSEQCEMMAKKATIMKLKGDVVLANDYAAKYLAIRRSAEEQG